MKDLSEIPAVVIPERPYKYVVAVVKDGARANKFVVRAADDSIEYHKAIRAALLEEVGLPAETSEDDWSMFRVMGGGFIREEAGGYVLSGKSTLYGPDVRRGMVAKMITETTGKPVRIAED